MEWLDCSLQLLRGRRGDINKPSRADPPEITASPEGESRARGGAGRRVILTGRY